jgi:hypothetical protein
MSDKQFTMVGTDEPLPMETCDNGLSVPPGDPLPSETYGNGWAVHPAGVIVKKASGEEIPRDSTLMSWIREVTGLVGNLWRFLTR